MSYPFRRDTIHYCKENGHVQMLFLCVYFVCVGGSQQIGKALDTRELGETQLYRGSCAPCWSDVPVSMIAPKLLLSCFHCTKMNASRHFPTGVLTKGL